MRHAKTATHKFSCGILARRPVRLPVPDTLTLRQFGTPGNADSNTPSASTDGRFVAFSSAALISSPNAPSGRQIYWRDTCAGAAPSALLQTTLISTDESGLLSGNIICCVDQFFRPLSSISSSPLRSTLRSPRAIQTVVTAGLCRNTGFAPPVPDTRHQRYLTRSRRR